MLSLRLQKELTVAAPIGPGKSAGARLVQEYLVLNGIHLGVDGDWGPATARALDLFAPGALTVDQALMDRLAAPLVAAVSSRAVSVTMAGAVVGVAHQHLEHHPVEIGGENMGPWVREYMDGNQGTSWPWCAGFATYVIRQACEAIGQPRPAHLTRTYSCDVLGSAARKAGKLVKGSAPEVVAGSLFLVPGSKPNDWVHTGIIIAVDDGSVTTIEGNTNAAGSREGIDVRQRVRARRSLDAVLL